MLVFASGFFDGITNLFQSSKSIVVKPNSQNIALLQSTESPSGSVVSDPGVSIVNGNSLLAEGAIVSTSTIPASSDQISVYVVHQGDTLPAIAKMFGVSVNTIVWANDIKGGKVTPGDQLVILPISGVEYTVKSGDTLKSVAKKFKGDIDEIAQFNNISSDSKLSVGDVIIIPDGEMSGGSSYSGGSKGGSSGSGGNSSPYYSPRTGSRGPSFPVILGYYERPIIGGIKTQGVHGHNGVDLSSYYGAPVLASADGQVIVARSGGWNGGYGSYVVIKHGNGTQTLYGHLSQVNVNVGQVVNQGDEIGKMGSSGDSTGTHLHFEIRGATNPF
jgi:murein DD-endopeptidase MepM/ murein hydrolase activator NlpD